MGKSRASDHDAPQAAMPPPVHSLPDRTLMDEVLSAVAEAKARSYQRWAIRPLDLWRERTRNVMNLIEIAGRGIAMVRGAPTLIEALDSLERKEAETEEESRRREYRLATAREQASLAHSEVDADFPLLHALGCAWLWTSLETLVEDLMIAVLVSDPTTANLESVRDVRVPLAVAASGDRELLAWAAYQELELRNRSEFKSGVTRFEGLLDLVGLGGNIPEGVKKSVFELGHVRNIVLHRGGIVDRVFVQACPWTGQAVGEPLKIGHAQFTTFIYATMHYAAVIESRVGLKYPRGTEAAGSPVNNESVGRRRRKRPAAEVPGGPESAASAGTP